jgi:hypothetical protein
MSTQKFKGEIIPPSLFKQKIGTYNSRCSLGATHRTINLTARYFMGLSAWKHVKESFRHAITMLCLIPKS